jgi:hypothetical protein
MAAMMEALSARRTTDWIGQTSIKTFRALMYSVALSADGSMMAGTQDNGAVFSSAGAHWDMLSGGDSSHDLIDPSDSTWAYYVIYIIGIRLQGQHADPPIDKHRSS